jgi:hypothetical protein
VVSRARRVCAGAVAARGRLGLDLLYKYEVPHCLRRVDLIILPGSFDFPGTIMPDLASRTVAAAWHMYDTTTATVVTGPSHSWYPLSERLINRLPALGGGS